jgi:hypothetical protein
MVLANPILVCLKSVVFGRQCVGTPLCVPAAFVAQKQWEAGDVL